MAGVLGSVKHDFYLIPAKYNLCLYILRDNVRIISLRAFSSHAKEVIDMNEKLYKAMGAIGAANLAIGICVLVGGITSGILLIVNGGRLLKHKSKITF